MKHISISLLGLFLAALPGCGAEFVSRRILWQETQFLPTLPCEPQMDADGASFDRTQFGPLRGQTYSCRDAWRNVGYVVTTGIFDAPSSVPMSEGTKRDKDSAVAAELSRQLCRAMLKGELGSSCSPGVPVENGHVTDVEISFTRHGNRFPARVRVSYPYMAAVLVIGNVNDDDVRLALDIQIPKP